MFSKILKPKVFLRGARNFGTTRTNDVKVAVVGGAGGIGQPLSMLLKMSDLISHINLYDIVKHTPGVVADLSHMNFPCTIKAFTGTGEIKQALSGVDVVVIPGGVPRKPGMTRDDLFGSNASVVRDVAAVVAEVCPDAMNVIITNPVNSVVPVFCEVMKKAGKLNPKRVFGISTLDSVRASTFIGELKGIDCRKITCPVIGGHSGISIVPVTSQCKPPLTFTRDELDKLIPRIQNAGTTVLKAKAGAGTATLAMAWAGARFTFSLLRGMKGESNVVECSFVMNDIAGTKYFATPLVLGKNGIERDLGMGKLSDYEQELINKAIPALKKNVEKGEKFVNS